MLSACSGQWRNKMVVSVIHSGEMNECLLAEMSEMTSAQSRSARVSIGVIFGLHTLNEARARWQHREVEHKQTQPRSYSFVSPFSKLKYKRLGWGSTHPSLNLLPLHMPTPSHSWLSFYVFERRSAGASKCYPWCKIKAVLTEPRGRIKNIFASLSQMVANTHRQIARHLCVEWRVTYPHR